jgi:hypothetical protein
MGSFTDFLEDELLDHVFGNASFSPSANVYIGLSTTTITDAGGNDTEPGGGAYARVTVANNATNWPAASGGAKANGTDFTFPEATASWGTIIDFAIYSALTAGNMYAYGTLTTSKAINNGDTAKFATGDIDITLN